MSLRENELENISLIDVFNDRGVCQHIDSRFQVSFSGLCQFAVPYSNAVVLKTKNFFLIFCSIYGIYIKF